MHAKQALEETILIWDSLARSGSDEKEDALTETGLLHASHYDSMCPLCEHAKLMLGGCRICLVWGKKDYWCFFQDKGEYWMWRDADNIGWKKYYAQKIADMARETLDKLEDTK